MNEESAKHTDVMHVGTLVSNTLTIQGIVANKQ